MAITAVPLLKLGRVLEEVRLAVRDIGHESVPILTELRGTVRATNDELGKLSLVTEDVAKVSSERDCGERERGPDDHAVLRHAWRAADQDRGLHLRRPQGAARRRAAVRAKRRHGQVMLQRFFWFASARVGDVRRTSRSATT